MRLYRRFLLPALMVTMASAPLSGRDSEYEKAVALYNNGLYAQSMNILQSLPDCGRDSFIDGYTVLCAVKQQVDGYESMMDSFLSRYYGSYMSSIVRRERAYDLFDKEEFEKALADFEALRMKDLSKSERAQFAFKKGYCYYKSGNIPEAENEFAIVSRMDMNDYSAPSQYMTGYIQYNRGNFREAQEWFLKSALDERFAAISKYYVVSCRFEQDDYDYVLENGVALYDDPSTPSDRKKHLARIISESYLVKGDKKKAASFFADSDDGSVKTRADYFYAGSLMYTTGNWQGAIDNYSRMTDKTDSLGQIALYQSAFSYVNLKNKVAALSAFKAASELQYDPQMTEDAGFNYAKLAFDLNGDTSVFADYMKKYSDKVRGEKIYSYMALAALADRDYQAAIDAYDKIDVLEGAEKLNYVHANYLRGAELLDNGSYRRAIQCMKAVTYYTPKNDRVSQLARYNLGEAFYRNGQYVDAQNQFTELYNNSALYGMPQGQMLPYNVGYSLFRQEKFEEAARWFDIFSRDGGDADMVHDAIVRKADCLFAMKQYPEAVEAYHSALGEEPDPNDVYPYYQCAVVTGLLKGNWKQQKKNSEDKLALLENVLKAEPTAAYYPEAMFELAKAQQGAKQTSQARQTLQMIIDNVPERQYVAKAMLEMGTMKRNDGDTDGALACYMNVVEKLSGSGYEEDALLAIESIYQSQNTPQLYLAYLDKVGRGASKTEEDKQNMFFTAAEQIFFSDNYQKALVSFQEFKQNYPNSEKNLKADFYIAECYRYMNDKVMASDAYQTVIQAGESPEYESALNHYADLNYALENYEQAYSAYGKWLSVAKLPASISASKLGMMRSAVKLRNHDAVIKAASFVCEDKFASDSEIREARMSMARSLLATSRREEAYVCFTALSAEPKTPEGAEASYLLIQECFDKADFKGVEDRVFAFSGSGTAQQYYLAKAFIVLGDSYAEQGKMKQAKATFQSIADEYKGEDEIRSEVQLRLDKINEMQK